MCKKVGFLAVLAVMGALVVSHTRVGSYVGTAWDRLSARAHKQVSPEFQLDRARHLVTKLSEDIEKQKAVVAEETVALRELTRKVDSTRASVAGQKEALAKRRADLDGGVQQVKYEGRTISASEAEEKLSRDFVTWTYRDDELKSSEKLLSVQEKKKAVAEQQLNALFTKKRELEVRIAKAEAKLKEVRLQQSESNTYRGDGTVSEVNAILDGIEHDLDVDTVKQNLDEKYSNEGKTTEPTVSRDEMRERLGVSKDGKVVRGQE